VTAVERSEVQWGRTAIPYAIRRSARRGTVSVAIDPEEGVLLTAPTTTPVERLDRVVRTKARWIVERLRRQSELPPALHEREFVSGETFLYLGKQYRLGIDHRREGAALLHGHLVVGAPHDPTRRSAHVRRVLVTWYRQHAQERLPEIAGVWARKLHVEVGAVLMREQRRRWGSCDRSGLLRLNWRIIQAPRACIEYVVAHEVVHVRHPNHTPAFWAALGRVMPDYERRRARLKALGASLVW
jgi:predicted metal-dependent hydrolase